MLLFTPTPALGIMLKLKNFYAPSTGRKCRILDMFLLCVRSACFSFPCRPFLYSRNCFLSDFFQPDCFPDSFPDCHFYQSQKLSTFAFPCRFCYTPLKGRRFMGQQGSQEEAEKIQEGGIFAPMPLTLPFRLPVRVQLPGGYWLCPSGWVHTNAWCPGKCSLQNCSPNACARSTVKPLSGASRGSKLIM